MKKKIVWYSRGRDIKRMGPYKSQLEACNSLRTTKGFPIEDAFVWCEIQEKNQCNCECPR